MKWLFYVIVFVYLFYRAVYGLKESNSLYVEPITYEEDLKYLPVGTRKTIACKVLNRNQKVEWLNNHGNVVKHENTNRVFSQTKHLMNSGRIVTEQVLTFTHAVVEDSGVYTCRTDKTSQEVELCVIDASDFVNTPKEIAVNQGRSYTLSCEARGQPEPRIVWNRNGEDIKDDGDDSSKYRLMEKYNRQGFESLLTITSLEADDHGIYTCTAIQENSKLSDCSLSKSWNITLIVNHAPVFLDGNDIELVYAKENQSVDLVCSASAFPKSSYRWFHYEDDHTLFEYSQKQIIDSPDTGEATLSIVADKSNYDRRFLCRATNELGNNSKTFTIVQMEKPDKPSEVNLVQSSDTELVLNISWFDIHFPIDGIEAQYMVVSGTNLKRKTPREAEWKRGKQSELVKVDDGEENIYSLQDLEEETEYWIRVRTKNDIGYSPWSSPISASTTKSDTTLLIVTMETVTESETETDEEKLDEETKDNNEGEVSSHNFEGTFYGLFFIGGIFVLGFICVFVMRMV
ncbi:limbic system-associated membrane protein-like [Galleria mellonella]|uniref:Limbic system-associated membrane protein-like n=1 Tax=Galleria mellonella TaxID=7137 RepID=A0A6J1WEM8_GALME|nr:limbic system-associated membrane protein-like [Galleria mellonella]